jgi:hypothetical protein
LSGAIYKHKRNQRPFSGASLLMIIWLLGLLIGAVFAFRVVTNGFLLPAWFYKFSFTTPYKYVLPILPFLLSAMAVFFSRPRWLYCICGIQSVLFSASATILCLRFGQAGWLAYWLFLFFETCSLPFLYCYWLRNLSNVNSRGVRECILLLPILALMIVDYRIITPYVIKFGLF